MRERQLQGKYRIFGRLSMNSIPLCSLHSDCQTTRHPILMSRASEESKLWAEFTYSSGHSPRLCQERLSPTFLSMDNFFLQSRSVLLMILSYQHDIAKSAPASKGLRHRQAVDEALILNFPHGLSSSKCVRRDAQVFTFPRRNSDSAQRERSRS